MICELTIGDYEIHNGPSREEMFDALRLRGEARWLTFELILPKTAVHGPRHCEAEVIITGIRTNFDSVTSWSLEGRMGHKNGGGSFKASYLSDRRQGNYTVCSKA